MPKKKGTPAPKPRRCEWCGDTFSPKRDKARFDSAACRAAKWNADHPRIGATG